MSFHARTAAPAPIPHQYVGTVADTTIGLLTAPANALDNGVRRIQFSNDRNWLSLMQAVHRSFFSSLQLAIESGLEAICREQGLKVSSRLRESIESAIGKIESVADDNEVVHRGIRDLRTFMMWDHDFEIRRSCYELQNVLSVRNVRPPISHCA